RWIVPRSVQTLRHHLPEVRFALLREISPFLPTPIVRESYVLVLIIQRGKGNMNIGSSVDSGELERLIREAENLHSAPGVAQSLLTLTRDPDFDIREVVECLERDPALSLRL